MVLGSTLRIPSRSRTLTGTDMFVIIPQWSEVRGGFRARAMALAALTLLAAGCSSVACLNRTVHYHDVPSGLTEDILREVFQHEISWVLSAQQE